MFVSVFAFDDVVLTNYLSHIFQGQKFTADLLSNGKIKSCETGQFFGTPSSWAIFCKKLVNPSKKSGCGWASVSDIVQCSIVVFYFDRDFKLRVGAVI